MRRRRAERGTALVEVTWLSLLLLVPLVYIVLVGLRGAAVRVRASTGHPRRRLGPTRSRPRGRGVRAGRVAAAAVALEDQGLDLSDGSMSVPATPTRRLPVARASVVQVRLRLPGARCRWCRTRSAATRPSVRVDAEHTVAYGTFREDRVSRGRRERGTASLLIVGFVARGDPAGRRRGRRLGGVPAPSGARLRSPTAPRSPPPTAIQGAAGLRGRARRACADRPRGRTRATSRRTSATRGAARRYPGLSYDVDAGTDRVVVHVRAPLDLPITPPGWERRPVIAGTAASFVVVSD